MSVIEERLRELGLELPRPPKAIGNFIYGVEIPGLLFVSGTYGTAVDSDDNDYLPYIGKVGSELTEAQGYQSARLAALNLLAMAKAVVGDLDRIERVVRLSGMVATHMGFQNAPAVVNGASDLLVDVFGTSRGRHARVAFPVHELARNAPVACEASFQVKMVTSP
jgi:enamine deaminase RidA (YjgF/YER057c/UK114 family)